MYRFALCETAPMTSGWYLIVEPDDHRLLVELHKGVASMYYSKYGLDPHYAKTNLAQMYNPIRLAGRWLATVASQLARGQTIIVNSRGGWLPLDSVLVLDEITATKMVWPDNGDDDVITISRWLEGRHYYLTSRKGQIISPSKCNTYSAALRVAEGYSKNVRSKGC